jgi:autotransporter-associated beta strand protein
MSAQDATWLASPGSGDWDTGSNWSTGSVPSGIATFGYSDTGIVNITSSTSIGTINFISGASNYFFNLYAALTITDGGITNPTVSFEYFNIAALTQLELSGPDTNEDMAQHTFIIDTGKLIFNETNTGSDFFVLFDGKVSGPGSVLVEGTYNNIVALTNTDSYTGGTTISGDHVALEIGNGGTTGSIVGNVDTGTSGYFAINRSDSYTFSGIISGGGNFSQDGPGTTILTGANTYTGVTYVEAGVLQLAATGSLSSAARLEVGIDATFNLNGNTQSVGELTGLGNITLGTGLLDFGYGDASSSWGGIISGAGSLEKVGTGTVTFAYSGGQTYTGGTTLEAGTLELAALGAAGGGAIKFAADASATLQVDNAAFSTSPDRTDVFTNTIDGFVPGDTIDLAGISYDKNGTATLESGNVLQIVENGQTYELNFDPTQPFVGGQFDLSPDSTVGEDVPINVEIGGQALPALSR